MEWKKKRAIFRIDVVNENDSALELVYAKVYPPSVWDETSSDGTI